MIKLQLEDILIIFIDRSLEGEQRTADRRVNEKIRYFLIVQSLETRIVFKKINALFDETDISSYRVYVFRL